MSYIFTRDCGATTGYSTNVSVGNVRDDPADSEIVFTADDNHATALTEGDAIWTRTTWTGPDTLLVAYASGARVFKQAQLPRLKITYRATGRFFDPPVPAIH